jgi:hypothetical protein
VEVKAVEQIKKGPPHQLPLVAFKPSRARALRYLMLPAKTSVYFHDAGTYLSSLQVLRLENTPSHALHAPEVCHREAPKLILFHVTLVFRII